MKANTLKIWRPYTQEGNNFPAIKIKSAKDSVLYLQDGRELLDCISSWWLNIHGHSTPEIAEAIQEQYAKLEQVVFADFVHEKAEELVSLLSEIIPKNLESYFFSDDGSTAVEVALKMALGYWKNLGESEERNLFIAFDGSYHGDTFGSMSVSSRSIFTRSYEKILFQVETVPFPQLNEILEKQIVDEDKSLEEIRNLFESKNDKIAGVIIEPLVQGAAGMRMCSPNFMKELDSIVKKFNSLLICDEVMTGFGRTGEWFASNKSDISPSIICLSKGLTGGVLPMGLTITTKEIYNSFNTGEFSKTLFHGHSYTGNALACAAAVASLKLFSKVGEKFRAFEDKYRDLNKKYLNDIPVISNQRYCGTIFALDINFKNSPSNEYGNSNSLELKSNFLAEGIYMRPLGNTIYLMPPYCFKDCELEFTFSKLQKVLTALV